MRKKWEIVILTCLVLVLGIGILSPVFSQFDGGGAFGSITNYLKQVMTSIIPNANNTYNLGAASKRFSNAYIVNANFADGTSMNTAASGASSNGNAGAVQLAGDNGAFAGNFSNLAYSGNTFYADAYALNGFRNYNYNWKLDSSMMLFYDEFPLAIGWPQENLLRYRFSGVPQGFFEWYMDDPFGVALGGPKTEALIYTAGQSMGATTQFNNFYSPTPVYLNSANASSGNAVGFSIGMENQLANASTPFVRIHSVKGNTDNAALVTSETIPSFEIGDLGTATSLPSNSANGSLLVDRNLAVGAGGSAGYATCFMADGKTLGHCTSLVGANGTCTCSQ